MSNSENFVVNINGEILPAEDARISVFDRGFLYGDSIYEVSYTKDKSILFFEEHLDRLFNSAELLSMQIYLSREEIAKQVLKTLEASNISNAYFRIIITRGVTSITLDPTVATHNNFIIIVKPRPVHAEKYYTDGIDLLLSSVTRNDLTATNPNAKSGNYLNNVMAMNEAKKQGFSDAIMINNQGILTEGTSFNFWLVKNGIVYTPKVESGILKGITRDKILSLASDESYKVIIKDLYVEDILSADEAFITSSTRGVMPVGKILINNELKTFSSNMKLTRLVREQYDQLVSQSILETSHKYN